MLGLISGTTKFMSKFVKFMAQKYLCQISANLWHKNIYVKFRQIYGTKIFMSNFGRFISYNLYFLSGCPFFAPMVDGSPGIVYVYVGTFFCRKMVFLCRRKKVPIYLF
jgi:hypothetical protein